MVKILSSILLQKKCYWAIKLCLGLMNAIIYMLLAPNMKSYGNSWVRYFHDVSEVMKVNLAYLIDTEILFFDRESSINVWMQTNLF
jgi:hypothetical protein